MLSADRRLPAKQVRPRALGLHRSALGGVLRLQERQALLVVRTSGRSAKKCPDLLCRDCDDPDEIIRHELRHVKILEKSRDEAQESAIELGRRRFESKAACERACEQFAASARREIDHNFGHVLVDIFKRGCKEWF